MANGEDCLPSEKPINSTVRECIAAIKAASLYQENFRDGTVIRTPSDKPRHPKNAADPWEKEKLERFRRNPELTEFWEITTLNGEKVLGHGRANFGGRRDQ